MTAFIEEHRGDYGVEPFWRILPIAPFTYHERVAQRDQALKPGIRRVFDTNFNVCGMRKVRRQIRRATGPLFLTSMACRSQMPCAIR